MSSAPGGRRPAASHYFSARPDVESRPRDVRVDLGDVHLTLRTDRGVFAGAGLDPGTEFLLREAPAPPATGTLADVGCGHGIIAVTLGLRAPSCRVVAVDVNERALELCRVNARTNRAANVEAMTPDRIEPGLVVDAIYSNPPVRIGKAALHALLEEWLGRLAPGGAAYLVVQRHLGSDSLARWLEERGDDVRRLGSRRGYRLLEVRHGAGG